MLKNMLKNPLILLLLIFFVTAQAYAAPLRITATEWAQPRSGELLLRHPVLAEAISQLQANGKSVLEIRYPGGDSGSLWARELQAWLVALGIESSRIQMLPGSSAADQLQLRIR